MTQLVEDLLFLARSDSAAAGMPMSPFDLRDAVRDAVEEVRDLAAERRMAISLSLPAEPLSVRGNRAALRRLFLALIDNALKYSPESGEVKVSLQEGTVAVADSGIGIGPAELPHVFQRFYRADKARSRRGARAWSLAGANSGADPWRHHRCQERGRRRVGLLGQIPCSRLSG